MCLFPGALLLTHCSSDDREFSFGKGGGGGADGMQAGNAGSSGLQGGAKSNSNRGGAAGGGAGGSSNTSRGGAFGGSSGGRLTSGTGGNSTFASGGRTEGGTPGNGGNTVFANGGNTSTGSGGSGRGGTSANSNGGSGGGAVVDACSNNGAFECLGAEQKLRRICQSGAWQSAPACDSSQNCERASGQCLSIISDCAGHTADYRFCDSQGRAATCGPDLVSVKTETCTAKCSGGLCAPPGCGDNHTDANEECDDGNTSNDDDCTAQCKKSRCGDGIKRSSEACDDGNTNNTDGCSNDCKVAKCGDGITQPTRPDGGKEDCDDGNTNNTDGCTNNCKAPKCGDGITQPTRPDGGKEECDDGNSDNTDFCNTDCKVTKCGDGVTQPTHQDGTKEECDDGNSDNTDFCNTDCKVTKCGDGVTQPTHKDGTKEECDDGNTKANDACSNNCTKPKALSQYDSGCQAVGQARDAGCMAAVRKYCADIGSYKGGMSQESNSTTIALGVGCFKDGSTADNVAMSTLSKLVSGCSSADNAQTPDCILAANKWCNQNKHLPLGLIEEVNAGGSVILVCAPGDTYTMDLATLAGYVDGNCKNIQTSIPLSCVSAAHRFCSKEHNLNGGMVQDVTDTSKISVVCTGFVTYGDVPILPKP